MKLDLYLRHADAMKATKIGEVRSLDEAAALTDVLREEGIDGEEMSTVAYQFVDRGDAAGVEIVYRYAGEIV